jgi:hypothetical protein
MPRKRSILTVGALTAALALPLGAVTQSASAATPPETRVAGLMDNGTTLVRFSLARAQQARRVAPISGLVEDTRLVGIDYRVQDGVLYGVGDEGGVYRVAPRGVARLVNRLTVDLEGSTFDIDFNPAADRLRILSDTGQNLRHDVSGAATPATVADVPLSTPPTAGTTTGVTAGAYTNNDVDTATGTGLFVINTSTDSVLTQSPANNGTLASNGSLGFNAAPDAGLDIGRGNEAFATLATPGRYRLFAIDLLTGKATPNGYFPVGMRISDLAIPTR